MKALPFALGGIYSISDSSSSSLSPRTSILVISAWETLGFGFRADALFASSFLASLSRGGAGVWNALVLAFVVFKPKGALLRGPIRDSSGSAFVFSSGSWARVPDGVINAFLSPNAPFFCTVVTFSLPLPLEYNPFLPPPNFGGPFSSFNGTLNGVFGTLFLGVFGSNCFVPWLRGLDAAADWCPCTRFSWSRAASIVRFVH